MKVSIVVPVYNKANYVAKAIESALFQVHDDIEVIAVDDGSTDDSPAILSELAGAHPNLLIQTQGNAGLSAARNAGMQLASGQYIMFHDADDVLELNAVSLLLKIAVDESSDVVGGVFRRHTDHKASPVSAYQNNDFGMNFRTNLELAHKYCTNLSSCNKLFRLDFLRHENIRFTPGLYMQDIEFWLKVMFTSENISQSAHIVSNYYSYPDSSSHSKTPARFDSLFILYERIEAFFAEQHLRDFSRVGNHALMQAALSFFSRWKLDEWSKTRDGSDLDRLSSLLGRIPDEDFVTFLDRKRGPNAAILLLIRDHNYAEAVRVRSSPYTGSIAWRRVFGHLDTAEKIVSFAKGSGKSRFKNAIYETYYLTPYYLSKRSLILSIPGKVGRKLSQLRRVTLANLKILLYPTLGPLRDSLRSLLGHSEQYAISHSPRPSDSIDVGIKILVFGLGDIYKIGGVQLSYRRLFEYLCEKGHRITFYAHRDRPKNANLYYRFPAGVALHHYKLQDSKAVWATIVGIAEQHDPDCILIVNSGQPALILAAALYDLPYPVVYSERGSSDYTLEHNWSSQTQRDLAHFASDFSHVLMPGYVRSAPTFLNEWVRVIPSVTEPGTGVADVESPGTDGRFTIIYSGRFSFEKDLDILIRSFAQIAEMFPAWDVNLLGDGPDREQLESLAHQLGIQDRVKFHGTVADLDAVFAAYLRANLFVLTSRAEGCPLALREAMAHGLPVIGFGSCSGTNEIIEHGTNGLLANSENKIEGLASAMVQLMGDADLRRRMGTEGLSVSTKYTADAIHGEWEKLLTDAAQWKGRREELRQIKGSRSVDDSDRLDDIFREVRAKGISRNIVAYSGSVRTGKAGNQLLSDYLLLYGSCLFDRLYYYASHLDVKISGVDPLEHYLLEGWRSGSKPRDDFDVSAYVESVMHGQDTQCPLIHIYLGGRDSRAKLVPFVSPGTIERLEAEKLDDREDWVEPGELCGERVAKALRSQVEWKPYTRDEIIQMTVA